MEDRSGNTTTSSAEAFYDTFADRYDDMIDFNNRMSAEAGILRPLVAEYNIGTAADMGCGTGVHALALASLGVDVLGIDISRQMLVRAADHAKDAPGMTFMQGDFLSPHLSRTSPRDAIFCVGNTLPHVESGDELTRILRYWKTCLAPGGHIFVQLLNYRRILETRERIVGVRQAGDVTTVRFYDFTEPRITFNILTIRKDEKSLKHALQSTLLLPITSENVAAAAVAAGCETVAFHASLAREDFQPESRDVVAIIR